MKKLLFIVALVALTISGYAQKKPGSAILKAGYQGEYKRLGIGLQARYDIKEQIRLAPEVLFFFPNNSTTGLNLNIDVHYVLGTKDGLAFYPLAGLGMINNRFSRSGTSRSWTDWGLNLGAGVDYTLKSDRFLNAEFKYTFTNTDFAFISLGYGIKF